MSDLFIVCYMPLVRPVFHGEEFGVPRPRSRLVSGVDSSLGEDPN